jgi:hypothetical protein
MNRTPGLRVALADLCRRTSKRSSMARTAQEDIARLFERTPVRAVGGQRCWGQHFDWSQSQYGIYGTSSGIQTLAMAGRDFSSSLTREASAVIETIEDPDSRFQLQRDHLNSYKLAFCVEATLPTATAINHETFPSQRLIAAALPSGGWPDYRDDPAEEPDASELATAVSLWALRRFEIFHGMRECDYALRFLIARHSGYETDISLRGPTMLGYGLLAALAYADVPAARRMEGYQEVLARGEKVLTRWARRRRRRELFDQFRYDFIERPHDFGPRDSDFIALMPDCVAAMTFMQTPGRLNATRRRYLTRVIDGIVREVREQDFRPRNVDKRASIDHLWAQRVLTAFLSSGVQEAFRHRHRIRAASQLSFWSRVGMLVAVAAITAWAAVAIPASAKPWVAVLDTFTVVFGGLAAEMLAVRFLK